MDFNFCYIFLLLKNINGAKIRLISEQLWRRLERKYEAKFQAWKENEEKEIDDMVIRLRNEYKQNIDNKQSEVMFLKNFQ